MSSKSLKQLKYFVLTLIFIVASCLLIVGCSSFDETASDGDSEFEISESFEIENENLVDGDFDLETEEEAYQPFDYCEKNTVPDADCYAEKRDKNSASVLLAKEIADKQIALKNAEDIKWDWGETVFMLGLVELYRVTDETKYFDYYKTWMDYHIETGFLAENYVGSSDKCAPIAIAVHLLAETGDQKYKTVIDLAFDYFENVALKTEDGGLNHLGDWNGLGVGLWIDSLFMFGNVMTGWGVYNDSVEALDGYVEQHNIFTQLLQSDLGFYKHAYGYKGNQDDDVYWARGNSWVVVATVDHLRARFDRGEKTETLRLALDKMVNAVKNYQDKQSGLWWTVLNYPEGSYLETSAAALFALGLARAWRYGLVDDSYLDVIKNAMKGVESRIERDHDGKPVITGTSVGTNPGSRDYYNSIKQNDDILYGVGAVIMALIESSGLPE